MYSTILKKLIVEFTFIVFKMVQMSVYCRKSCPGLPQSVKSHVFLGGGHHVFNLTATYSIKSVSNSLVFDVTLWSVLLVICSLTLVIDTIISKSA